MFCVIANFKLTGSLTVEKVQRTIRKIMKLFLICYSLLYPLKRISTRVGEAGAEENFKHGYILLYLNLYH